MSFINILSQDKYSQIRLMAHFPVIVESYEKNRIFQNMQFSQKIKISLVPSFYPNISQFPNPIFFRQFPLLSISLHAKRERGAVISRFLADRQILKSNLTKRFAVINCVKKCVLVFSFSIYFLFDIIFSETRTLG